MSVCIECKGTGKIPEGHDCPACGVAVGLIKRPEFAPPLEEPTGVVSINPQKIEAPVSQFDHDLVRVTAQEGLHRSRSLDIHRQRNMTGVRIDYAIRPFSRPAPKK